jgi:hypothetical protein
MHIDRRSFLATLGTTALFAFAHLCAVAMAQQQPAVVISQRIIDSATYITHVTAIDTEAGKEIQDRTVIISGDRISEVRDNNGMKPIRRLSLREALNVTCRPYCGAGR